MCFETVVLCDGRGPESTTPSIPNRGRGCGVWTASLLVLTVEQPLFAFATLAYAIPKSGSEPNSKPTERLVISSLLQTCTPNEFKSVAMKAKNDPSPVDD